MKEGSIKSRYHAILALYRAARQEREAKSILQAIETAGFG